MQDILDTTTFNTGYDSDTDDDSEEFEKSPPAKRQKLESNAATSGSSPSALLKVDDNRDENCVPFLLTTVCGIASEFNTRNIAIGIKGIYGTCIINCGLTES